MSTPVPISLSDGYLLNVLDNPSVRSMFPHLHSIREQYRKAAAECGTCGATTTSTAVHLDKMRSWLLGLPDPELKKLKTVLGIPDRVFVSYIAKSNGMRKKITR